MSGRIELICGPMFSGKTTALIDRLRHAHAAGANVRAAKPAHDTRYSLDQLVSHDGLNWAAHPVSDERSFRECTRGSDVVGLDEVHFFSGSWFETLTELAESGVRVVVAGVDLDHRGMPFDIVARLERVASEVVRLTARCARCGGVARHSQRLVASDARIIVGGAESYEPRCLQCFEMPAPG